MPLLYRRRAKIRACPGSGRPASAFNTGARGNAPFALAVTAAKNSRKKKAEENRGKQREAEESSGKQKKAEESSRKQKKTEGNRGKQKKKEERKRKRRRKGGVRYV